MTGTAPCRRHAGLADNSAHRLATCAEKRRSSATESCQHAHTASTTRPNAFLRRSRKRGIRPRGEYSSSSSSNTQRSVRPLAATPPTNNATGPSTLKASRIVSVAWRVYCGCQVWLLSLFAPRWLHRAIRSFRLLSAGSSKHVQSRTDHPKQVSLVRTTELQTWERWKRNSPRRDKSQGTHRRQRLLTRPRHHKPPLCRTLARRPPQAHLPRLSPQRMAKRSASQSMLASSNTSSSSNKISSIHRNSRKARRRR